MHQDPDVPPYQRLVAEIGRAGGPAVTIVAGPGGGELESALDQVCAYAHRTINVPADPCFVDQVPAIRMSVSQPGTVVLLRDVHNAHPGAVPALEALVRHIAAIGARCVCGVRLPLPSAARTELTQAFARLRRDGLARHVTLRPHSRLADVIISTLAARPEPALVTRVWELTRGWPAAVQAVLTRDSGSIRVVDQHVYLTGHDFTGSADEPVRIRALGDAVWRAAKAIAVLHPLGEAATELVAQAMGVSVTTADDLLARTGVLRHRRTDRSWAFRQPLVAGALRAALGPYELRRLAELAVHALWRGTATCADPHFLPDRLVDAGRLVDAERAKAELLAAAGVTDEPDRVTHWLAAAAELATEPADQAGILMRHAWACVATGRGPVGLASAEALLGTYADDMPRDQFLDVCFAWMALLHQAGEFDALERVAAGTWWPWRGTEPERLVGRAFAQSRFGRWRAAHDLLAAVRQRADAGPVDVRVRSLAPTVDLWLGMVDEFERDVSSMANTSEVDCHVATLLALGEGQRAEKLLADTGRDPAHLGLPARAVLAFQRGGADDVLELTRKHVAGGARNGCDAVECAMYWHAATVLLWRGGLTRGRALVALARARQPVLPHLLAAAESLAEAVLGDLDRAEEILWAAVRQTEVDGVTARTEPLWTGLSDIAISTGRATLLPGYLRRAEQVAERLGTVSADIARRTLHAVVHGDRRAAHATTCLARQSRHPLETANVFVRLVRGGVADPELLCEAYALAGSVDALKFRAWMRNLMREHGIKVPHRQATVAENERLLAVLVAEGLGNRQIAKSLRITEKSVEGRLSRLFGRTGHRCRIDLATAMLTGQVTFG